jgi:hypothetical protein
MVEMRIVRNVLARRSLELTSSLFCCVVGAAAVVVGVVCTEVLLCRTSCYICIVFAACKVECS